MHEQYLFPKRLTRRDFIWTGAASAAAATMMGRIGLAHAADAPAEVKIGSGKYTFTLDPTWGQLPEGMKYGLGCAIVVDGQDRVIVTSRSANPCVAIFDKNGQLVETWSKEFASDIGFESPDQVVATAHGLYLNKEGDTEYLYWTENVASPGGKRIGARVYKTDMKGKVLYTLGNVEKESSTSQKFDFTNPTDVAVAANGDIYIVDGYGSQLLHRFDKNFKLIKTAGGKGAEHGKFNTCHGVWVSNLRSEPELFIADRGNNRIEILSLDLDYKRTIPGVRMPCCFYEHKGLMFVPELGARVSIIDDKDQIVAQLGDGTGIPGDQIQQHPDKFATPHALTVDSSGNFYVLEWLPFGRPRKFKYTPTA
jgi:peptidylamidoglycolate lyase